MSRRPAVIARGSRRNADGMRRIVCCFDEETFLDIQRRAKAENTSFAEQVRTLVTWGLMDAADAKPVSRDR